MRVLTSLSVLVFSSAACVTVRPVAAPADFVTARNPEFVWVQHHDGELMPIGKPAVQGDSLIGTRLDTREPVRLALPRIQTMSARQPDHKRTAMLVATVVGLTGFIAYRALAKSSGPRSSCFFDGHDNVWYC